MATELLGLLPELSWRGLTVPTGPTPYDGGHEQARRAYPYIDGQGHDNTGRKSYRFQAKCFFLDSLEDGLYPERWNEFREALEDGSSGDLVHPDLGKVRARVIDWHVTLDPMARAGVVVDVTWEETIDDTDAVATFTGPEISAPVAAEAADAAMSSLGINYPTGESTSSLSELVGQVTGAIASAQMTIDGMENRMIGMLGGIYDAAAALNDHGTLPLMDSLTALYSAMSVYAQRVASRLPIPVESFGVTADTTLEAFAAEHGNTVTEIMGLNLEALRSPVVKAGTALKFYKK
jgi:prophage DNA circulation protein